MRETGNTAKLYAAITKDEEEFDEMMHKTCTQKPRGRTVDMVCCHLYLQKEKYVNKHICLYMQNI